ncbi:hypothetical protein HYPDE_28808 [Hyphomicrobium denitrificans 1NES1]|uniref:Sulfur globule protein n=1 Tax=Hyphomicrobium denitrificans 1NES1 TaxID=670307 RepID=N0BBE5_9HYPH|nr:hypothetical protein [Hyphomicrobium denitrificans]AGK57440.1 hypothetical protein HYPDE_28808 [Hyphomicrobium denitrificans 1NES1]
MTSTKQLAAAAFAALAVVGFSASAEAYHGRGYGHWHGYRHGFYGRGYYGHRGYWGHRGWGYYPAWGYAYPHCYWRYGRRICWY